MTSDAEELVPSQFYELLVTKRKGHSEWRSMPLSCDVLAAYQTYQPRKVIAPVRAKVFFLS